MKQSEQITDGLKKVANQKKNAVDVLKIENQQLKDRNHLINTKLSDNFHSKPQYKNKFR